MYRLTDSAHRRSTSAFTLIELLVVIAIIAILAAILFPVFAKAREKARQTSCLSNQKQIANALMMYSQDYEESFPAWPFGSAATEVQNDPRYLNGWSYALWVDALMPYVKNGGVFACPSGLQTSSYQRGPTGNKIYVHLAYNEYIMDTKRGWFTQAALSNSKNGIAEVSIIADSQFAGIYNDWGSSSSYVPSKGGNAEFGLARLYCGNGVGTTDAQCIPRHTDYGANVVFADGHAKFIPGGRINGRDNNPRGEYPIVNPNVSIYK